MQNGVLDVYVDDLVPCLKNSDTGKIVETVVFRIETKNFLKKYNFHTGWGINWYEVVKDTEVYALATKEDMEVQGLIAIKPSNDARKILEVYDYEWNSTDS